MLKETHQQRESFCREVKKNMIKIKPVQKRYDVVVIDPPWEIVTRKGNLPYPSITNLEIAEILLDQDPFSENCHVFLWTTQKFLPESIKLVRLLGLEYSCVFTWVKNRGMKPVQRPEYKTEFIVYARAGRPKFSSTKQFSTVLNANRQGHSVKPEEFYTLIRRVTEGSSRLDMFNRRRIYGFDGWGLENPDNKEFQEIGKGM